MMPIAVLLKGLHLEDSEQGAEGHLAQLQVRLQAVLWLVPSLGGEGWRWGLGIEVLSQLAQFAHP